MDKLFVLPEDFDNLPLLDLRVIIAVVISTITRFVLPYTILDTRFVLPYIPFRKS